jgi:D-lactate dehydrogenase
MAPFVEMEWGKDAAELMRRIKHVRPGKPAQSGVILNDNPPPTSKPQADAGRRGHRRPLHRMRLLRTALPVHRLTLSPRQRIVSVRELSRRAAVGEPAGSIGEDYAYMGLDTCAACGCALPPARSASMWLT